MKNNTNIVRTVLHFHNVEFTIFKTQAGDKSWTNAFHPHIASYQKDFQEF